MKKILNNFVGFLLKALLKVYKRPNNPNVINTDVGQVLNNFPEEGGMESWIPGHDFPFPGMPDARVVETMTVIKKMFPVIYRWAWLIMRDRLPNHMMAQSQNGDIGLVDPKKYSKPVRELHRVFTLVRNREGEDIMKGKWTEMRDILCLFFEYDDAYRFRLMDVMSEINLKEFEFTDADKHWASMKWRYEFGFKKNKDKKI